MSILWPAVSYDRWRGTCDTLHAHTQVLGKLAARLAPAEPELQHAALRLTVRGWETAPLPAPDGWGAFDLAVNVLSGVPTDPPSDDFISRNSGDAETVAVGWWPGDARHPQAAFYGYAYPAVERFSTAQVAPAAARWDDDLAEFILDWEDVRVAADPHAEALAFARSVFRVASARSGWGNHLTGSLTGTIPPLRPRQPVPPERTPA